MAKFKVNYKQLPVKAHFFFFMAAMGPILPFLPVYGKQLGISAMVMGTITGILPIFFLIAKPCFGFLVDYFRSWRKSLFIGLLAATSGCYVLFYFLPPLPGPVLPENGFRNVNCTNIEFCEFQSFQDLNKSCSAFKNTTCHWSCNDDKRHTTSVLFRGDHDVKLSSESACLLDVNTTLNCNSSSICNVKCDEHNLVDACIYGSLTFWGFVLLMSLGNIGFNVSNSLSDAICFDVLGEGGQMGYGRQRVWGTIGFGVTAFLSGFAVDLWSNGQASKSYTPAFVLVLAFSSIDLLCCKKLQIPTTSESESILKDVWQLLRMKPIAIFLCFATIAGILDSFIIYFLFWYLEDLATTTNDMDKIKFIEGSIVAAETLGGELIFFLLSGKILKKFGYGNTFAFCFMCYAIRLGLISLAPTPWWIIPIELFMQGPTYALCYTTIVAYASAVAPQGTSATVQGIVAGMDDGFGFAVGSVIGGILYTRVGGVRTLQLYSALAAISSVAYFILYRVYLRHVMPKAGTQVEAEYKSPKEANITVAS